MRPYYNYHTSQLVIKKEPQQFFSPLQQTTTTTTTTTLVEWRAKLAQKQKPCGRYGHRCVLESYLGKHTMILSFGYNGKERLNDLFEYDLDHETWTKIPYHSLDTQVPTPRDCHSAVLYHHQMIIWGGGNGVEWLNCCYSWCCITKKWTKIQQFGQIPCGRAGHTANVYQNKMLLFGGWNGRRTLNDMYEFDFTTCIWTKIEYHSKSILPQPRDSHTSCLTKNGNLYVIGGGDQRIRLNDVLQYNRESKFWTLLQTNSVPSLVGRAGHVACLNSTEDKIILFGGGSNHNSSSNSTCMQWPTEVLELDLLNHRWSVATTKMEAAGCYGLSAVVFKNTMILFGGGNGFQWHSSVISYSMDESMERKQFKWNLKQQLSNIFIDVEIYCSC